MKKRKEGINVKKTSSWTVLVCGMICMTVMGLCYTYSIFQPYIMSRFEKSSVIASYPYTAYMVFFCIGNFFGGKLQLKIGVKKTVAIGYFLMFAGWYVTSLLSGDLFYLMFFSYGLLFGVGDGIAYNVLVTLMPKWFPERKGLASGLIFSVLGISASVFSQLAGKMLQKYDFAESYKILSLAFIIVGIFGIYTLKEPSCSFKNVKVTYSSASKEKQYEVNEVFADKRFWMLVVLYFCAVPAYLLLSGIYVSYGVQRGIQLKYATMGVSAAAVFQVLGRLIIPSLSDRIGRKTAFVISFIMSIVGIVLLKKGTDLIYIVSFCLISFSYGSCQASFSPIAADSFGTKNLGTILSLIMIGFGFGSVASSLAASLVGIEIAFAFASVAAAAGALTAIMFPVKNINHAGRNK